MSGSAISLEAAVDALSRRLMRLALALLLLILLCSLAVIYSAHRSRQMFVTLEEMRREENRLQEEWRQLLLERSALAAHARVEKLARDRLVMQPPGDAIRVVLP